VSWQAPNLARSRFENLRPLRRISLLLAACALALTAWNAAVWVRTGALGAERSAELARLTSETAEARSRVATLEADLEAADLETENERVEFLNHRIAERAFSWNLLLDRLVEALPAGVRLRQLSPSVERSAAGPRRVAAREREIETVALRVTGEAEGDEALLELVDNLFGNPHFRTPDLAGETTRDDGLVQFSLEVRYLPGEEAPAPAPEAAPADLPEARP
jgi:Tfp pilus assembly protein PilN